MLGRVLHYVSACHLSLRGEVDALVFAGGIRERSQELRNAVGEAVSNLGYSAIDEHVNQQLEHREDTVVDIGKHDEGKCILLCKTDEQSPNTGGDHFILFSLFITNVTSFSYIPNPGHCLPSLSVVFLAACDRESVVFTTWYRLKVLVMHSI